MATKARLWPDTPTHPGEILADELAARQITFEELAVTSGVGASTIEAVVAGTAPITAALAWALESALEDVSARFWMGLQADYDLGIERLRRNTA